MRIVTVLFLLTAVTACGKAEEECPPGSRCANPSSTDAGQDTQEDDAADTTDVGLPDADAPPDVRPSPAELVVGVQVMPLQFDLQHAESTELTAVAVDVEGNVIEDAPIRWSTSSGGEVITVNQGGIAFAKSFSADVVIATVGDVHGLSEGRVRDANGEYFSINLPSWTASVGQSLQLTPGIFGPDGELIDENPTVTYSVSDENILIVDETGFLYAASSGYGVVFAEHDSGRKSSMPVWVD